LDALTYLVWVQGESLRPEAAIATARDAAALIARQAPKLTGEAAIRHEIGYRLSTTAVCLRNAGALTEAACVEEFAIHALQALVREEPGQLRHRVKLGDAWRWLGKIRWKLVQHDAALDALRQAVAERRLVYRQDPGQSVAFSNYIDTLIHFLMQRGFRTEV